MNRSKTTSLAMAALALALAGAFAAYRFGLSRSPSGAATAPSVAAADPSAWTIAQGEAATRRHIESGLKAGDIDPRTERRVLYWHDPMVPGKRFDAPAKSPFMDMMLVPMYAAPGGGSADAGDPGSLSVSPRIQQNLGLRTAEVVRGTLSPQVEAVGAIAWNEREQAVVQARATGYIEKLQARAVYDRVAAGAALAELYVPDWVAAQEEFLALRRMPGEGLGPLVDGARARMRQAGMSAEMIALVEQTGQLQPRITLRAPTTGVLSEVNAREGMTVMAGATLFRIQGTATVWAQAEVPESQGALLRPGSRVTATSPALPGERFAGQVQALLPEVDATTRTRKARLELGNPGGQLVPGMLLQMQFLQLREHQALLVPTEALLRTGQRTLVMLAEAENRFRPVEVSIGLEAGAQTEVIKGLTAGQRIVISSQFLIDSEASLRGLETRLNQAVPAPAAGSAMPAAAPASAAPAPAPAALHRTPATVKALAGDMVTLDHPPIASLKWPAMTMDFRLPPAARRPAGGLKPGDQITIEFQLGDDELPQLTRLQRSAGGKP